MYMKLGFQQHLILGIAFHIEWIPNKSDTNQTVHYVLNPIIALHPVVGSLDHVEGPNFGVWLIFKNVLCW